MKEEEEENIEFNLFDALETEIGYFDANFTEKVPIHSLRYLIFIELLDFYKQQPDKLGLNQDIDINDVLKKAKRVESYIMSEKTQKDE